MGTSEIATSLDTTFWVPLFLDNLRREGVLSVAARMTGISASVVHAKRRIDRGFDDAVKAAIGESVDEIEHEGRRRAMAGGDRLLLEFLRAKRPEEFKRPEVAGATSVTVNVDTRAMLQEFKSSLATSKARIVETTAVPVEGKDDDR